MPIQLLDAFSGFDIPDTDHLVVASRNNLLCVVRDLDTCKAALMTGKGLDELLLADAPHLDGCVTRSRDDKVVLDGDGINGSVVAEEGVLEGEGLAVPNGNGGVFAAGNDVLGIKSNVEDSASVLREASDWDVAWEGPDDASVIAGSGYEDLLIKLKTKDGLLMDANVVRILPLVERVVGMITANGAITKDLGANLRSDVPNANCMVTTSSKNLIPIVKSNISHQTFRLFDKHTCLSACMINQVYLSQRDVLTHQTERSKHCRDDH